MYSFETMSMCCVEGCNNRGGGEHKIFFHKFPKDPSLKQAWILAIRRQSFTPNNRSVVCSDHFEKACFYEERLLKEEAIPTVFPTHRAICEIIRIPVDESTTESPEELAKLSEEIASSIANTTPDISDAQVDCLNHQLKKLTSENADSRRKLKSLQQKSRRCSRRITVLEQFINSFRKDELMDNKSLELLKAIPPLDNELLHLQLCLEQDLPIAVPSVDISECISDSNSD